MRCGNRLVSTGDSNSRVVLRCGEPIFSEVIAVEKSKKSEVKKENKIEKRTYDLGIGKQLRILTFQNGKLIKIESEWK
jgi:hypothetical protein